MTVKADLALIRSKLHDPNEDIWTDEELLRVYNDGYRQMLSLSGAVRRWRPTDLPGRHLYALTQDWEDGYTKRATVRKAVSSIKSATLGGSGLWETEAIEGLTSTASLSGYAHEWERAHISGDTDHHFRFSFPRNHDRVARLEWQNRKLHPISVRELDETDTRWFAQIGEPRWWTSGAGRIRSVELYEIATTYYQGYAQSDVYGTSRQITGSRTYSVSPLTTNANMFAYTTQGDAQAVTEKGSPYDPGAGYTFSWEPPYIIGADGVNFTVNLTMNLPDLATTVVHPWEYGHAGGPPLAADASGSRGMFAWERLDPAGAYETNRRGSGHGPVLGGLARRMTRYVSAAATGTLYATQPWEVDTVDAASTQTTGAIRPSFPWEQQHGALAFEIPLGTMRQAESPDRQYVPMYSDVGGLYGRCAEWRSSEDSVMALEVVLPDAQLGEDDTATLIPQPLTKYLRFYTLAWAFGRVGEGRQPILSDHYARRFAAGVQLLAKLGDIAHLDHVYQREETRASNPRVARVQLPSTYPRVM